ncbi:MAG: leucine-rich repeat domain-containing protein [Trueperaceae bacterium]
MKNIPVIFLAMTSPAAALRDVQRERSVIRKALEKAQMNGHCVLLEAEVKTVEDIFQVFRNYPQKISIFHYAGHGNEDALLLYLEKEKSRGLNASTLTTLLNDSSIKVVFLNSCSSQSHAEALLETGAPVVIATSNLVHDDIACDFAEKFYEGLANGHTIKRAFQLSKSELMTRADFSTAPTRGPVVGTRKAGEHAELWKLYTSRQGAESWRLELDSREQPASHYYTSPLSRSWIALALTILLASGALFVARPFLSRTQKVNHSNQTTAELSCENQIISIPDPQLLEAIREKLGKPSGEISCLELVSLENLDASGRGINDLTGLEYAVNLNSLELGNNQLTDVSAISTLTKLRGLNLRGNALTTLEPLANLKNLERLFLGHMPLTDLSPVYTLSNLELLHMNRSSVSDLNFLSGSRYPNLKDLELDGNKITDIADLKTLDKLENLSLEDNDLTDLTPLVENPGLGEGDTLHLNKNHLDLTTGTSHHEAMTNLRNRGVKVHH